MTRWERLFADLEAQLAAAEQAALESEVADRSRREAATLSLVDRVRCSTGSRIHLRVAGAGVVEGVLSEVGSQWLLVTEPTGQEALVPLGAVQSLAGLAPWSAAPGTAGKVFERLGLAAALRGIARDRAGVAAWLVDGATVTGTIDRVGADFFELSAHAPGELRRPAAVHGLRVVPFAALGLVRRTG